MNLHRSITVVVTVRNDRAGLEELLPALAAQDTAPHELVIVDGGSVDDSLDVIARFECDRFPVRVAVSPGANIAAGRNAAVRLAGTDWVACTDAGCRPVPGWLGALAEAAAEADIVAGVFVTEGATPFERIVAVTHYPVISELDERGFLVRLSHLFFGRRYLAPHAGGRSMAFSKRAWEEVGGFPEHQYAGEDLAFAAAVVERGYRLGLARQAEVRWRPPQTWRANATMFFRYCRGDVRSKGRARHAARLVAWTGGAIAFASGGRRARVGVIAGASAYIALPVSRARQAGIPLRDWWRIPLVVALKDISQLAGAAFGVVDAVRGVPQPTPQPAPDVSAGAPRELSAAANPSSSQT
jgi:cellulose synthase/poly-beta-1,6-N-acetylglucosamine synthase-like glycosyltransferase